MLSNDLASWLLAHVSGILVSKFPAGIDPNSFIDMKRLRFALPEDMQTLDSHTLQTILKRSGILVDGKIYAVAQDANVFIKEKVEAAFRAETSIICYEAFLAKHSDDLAAYNICDVNTLRTVMQKAFQDSFHSCQGYLRKSSASSTAEDLKRVFAGGSPLTYAEIQQRLPYCNLEQVKTILRTTESYISTAQETYISIDSFDISLNDIEEIQLEVVRLIHEQGYCSMFQIHLERILENNPQFGMRGVQAAVFQKALAGQYSRNYYVLTPLNQPMSTNEILAGEIRRRERLTLSEIEDIHENISGTHNYSSLEAAYAVMVRIDRDLFVSAAQLRFDVAAIDGALDGFITKDCLPLREFTAFLSLPWCRFTWTSYLLGSYLRSYSRRYYVLWPVANSSNIGIIVKRRPSNWNYDDAAAQILAASDIPLESRACGKWLAEHGVYGKSLFKKLPEVVQAAQQIREKRGA